MRNVIFIVMLLFLISVFACASCARLRISEPPITARASDVTDDIYAVYSAILNREYKDRFIFIADRTSPVYFGQTFGDNSISGLSDETINDYDERNKTDEPLQNAFSKDLHYALLSNDEQKQTLTKTGRENYLKKYPEAVTEFPPSLGIITFSKIGFNGDRTQALVSVNDSCPALCGSGQFYFLRKQDGNWSIEGVKELWVS